MAKEMTLDEAIEILKGSISNPRFAEAKKFVMDNDPTNPLLRDVELKEKEYEKENNLETDDIKVYDDNTEVLNELEEGYNFDVFTQDEGANDLVDHVVVYDTVRDEDGKPVQTSQGPADKMLSKEESREYTSLLFDAAKLKAKMHLTGDGTFSALDAEERVAKYKGLVERIFITDLAVVAVANDIDTSAMPEIGTKEYEEHISKTAQEAMEVILDTAKKGQNINIQAEHILACVADTAQKVETYANRLREKAKKLVGEARTKLNEISVGFNTRLNKLEDKADKVSKGKYRKYIKPILTSAHDNKVQLVGNTIATIALTSALATPAAPWALGAYGAYFAATSWIYPIVERARRNNRIRKEKGEEKLKFGKALREAGEQLFAKKVKVTDEETGETKEIENKERKKYIRRAAIKSALGLTAFTGIAVAAQTGSGFVPLSWLTRKLLRKGDVAELGTKAGVIGTKMVVTNTAQATEVGVALGAVSKNASAENKQDLKNAAVGFGVGLAASALTQVLTGNTELFGSKGDEIVDKIADNNGVSAGNAGANLSTNASGGWLLDNPKGEEVADTTGYVLDGGYTQRTPIGFKVDAETEELAAQGDAPVEDLASAAAQTEFEPFPREWSEDLGLSRREYNNFMSRLPGILKEVDENSPDRLYNNLNDEVMANFPDKTKMQVLYETMEQYRNGRRSQYVLGNANFKFTDMNGEEQVGFYINTPTGKVKITDEGVIAAAKQALANGDKVSVARLHGEDFLVGQFHKMNIEGMDTEKMDAIVKIAMETYNPNEVKNAVVKIHEILPALDKAQLATITKIVDYNRRFDQNGETMEALLHMIACGEQNGNGAEMNTLLDRTQEILAQSHGNAVPMGQEVDCGEDHLVHVHRTVKEVKVEEQPVEERPVLQKLATRSAVPTGQAECTNTTDLIQQPHPVTEEKEAMGRVFVSEHRSDNECDHITGQKEYKDEQLKSMVENSSRGR